jgi:hypothetical protein
MHTFDICLFLQKKQKKYKFLKSLYFYLLDLIKAGVRLHIVYINIMLHAKSLTFAAFTYFVLGQNYIYISDGLSQQYIEQKLQA